MTVTSKSLLRRATHDVGARTHYLAANFSGSRKSAQDKMVAIKKRHLKYEGGVAKIVHTLVDGRQVRYTIQIV
jgi:hypothetical protein